MNKPRINKAELYKGSTYMGTKTLNGGVACLDYFCIEKGFYQEVYKPTHQDYNGNYVCMYSHDD